METKIFGDKKIVIRKLTEKDLKNVKKFQDFINSLIKKEAKILMNKKMSFKEEQEWLKDKLDDVKKHKEAFLVAECANKIIAITGIGLNKGRRDHVADFGITIRQGYREIGLGRYLTAEVLKLAQKELKPKPEIIRLSVYLNNKPAINLYRKYGFKIVAKIPKQIQYKDKLIDEMIMLLYL